jgi:hypothetical protein
VGAAPKWSSRRRSTASRTPLRYPRRHRGRHRPRRRPCPHPGRCGPGEGDTAGMTDDEKVGFKIVKAPSRSPSARSRKTPAWTAPSSRTRPRARRGHRLRRYKMVWVDMVKEGIIDPAKVTRSALQNAARGGPPPHHRCAPSRTFRAKTPPPAAPAAEWAAAWEWITKSIPLPWGNGY